MKQSDDPVPQLYDNPDESSCANESVIEEESQYTVSRILKICADAERDGGNGGTTNCQVAGFAVPNDRNIDPTMQLGNAYHSLNMPVCAIEGETSHHIMPNTVTTLVHNITADKPFPTFDKTTTDSNVTKANKKSRRKNRKNPFIDDEAAVFADDGTTGEESDDDEFATQWMISEVDDDDNSIIDMKAEYLQSIKSPIGQQRFRIDYRNTAAPQNIFSQAVSPDQSQYEKVCDFLLRFPYFFEFYGLFSNGNIFILFTEFIRGRQR